MLPCHNVLLSWTFQGGHLKASENLYDFFMLAMLLCLDSWYCELVMYISGIMTILGLMPNVDFEEKIVHVK